jgi:transcription initiation factor TFIID TATA-box-binding protein
MDQPLPSPGFSIPSIGTPMHLPEEDQQILPHAYQQQQQAMENMTPIGQSYNQAMQQKHTYA